jgi:beta-xylosidase
MLRRHAQALLASLLTATCLTALAPAVASTTIAERLQTRTSDPLYVSGESLAWEPGRTYSGTFADPDVATSNGRWYAYATNTSNLRLPTLISDDLTNWRPAATLDGYAYEPFRMLPSWVRYPAGGGTLWAPSVAPMGYGWTLAYSAHESTRRGVRHNCIGLARASAPVGPFTAISDKPLLCGDRSALGVIDPDLYTDPSGRNWLLWKFSGIAGKQPATLMSRQLNESGSDWMPGSRSTQLLTHRAGGWEGDTIENPSMVTYGGRTYLFYSSNSYRDHRYNTGYAMCAGPTGPCERAKRRPLLSTAKTLPLGYTGPGGAAAFEYGQALRLMYHAWDRGYEGSLRRMHVATLRQKPNGKLVVRDLG